MSTNVYVIEEGTTNLLLNPLTPSERYSSNGVLFNETSEGETTISIEVAESSRRIFWRTRIDTITPSSPLSVSLEVRAINEGITASVGVTSYTNNGSYLGERGGSEYVEVPTDRFIRLTTSRTDPFQPDASRGGMVVNFQNNQVGDQLIVRNPQVETKPYATSFAHGDMGEGYSWEGTPHRSASIREPSSISIPTPEPESLYIRYSEDGEIWNNKYVSFEDKPEDIEPTLFLSPDGSYDRDGEVTPTISGGVIEVDGEYGKAWQIAEATTNLHTRPIPTNASGGVGGWYSAVSIGSEINLALDTDFEPSLGPWRLMEITTIGGPTHTFHHSARVDIDASGTYTASLYIATSREMTVPIYAKVGNSYGTELAAKTVTLGPTPKRVELTFSATAGQEVHWGFLHTMNTYSPLEGDKFWITRAQLEDKEYATPYCDGDMGSGHSWTGTPSASTSTRASASLILPIDWDLKNGSFILRMRHTGKAIHNGYIMNVGSWNTQQNMRILANGSAHPTMRMRSGTLSESAIYFHIQDSEYLWLNPVTLYGYWTEDKFGLREDFGNPKTLNRSFTSEAPNAQILTIGSGSQPSQMVFESILFYDTPLTEVEIERIITMNKAWTWEEATGFKVTADLGQHAKIRYVDNDLKLLTDKKLYIGTVIGFSRPLSQKEIDILDSTPLEYISDKTLLNLPDTTIGVSRML